jgi:uncharacterized protein YcaQ
MRVVEPRRVRETLIGQAGLRSVIHPPGDEGLRALLRARRCIQLDPLDRIGTNADLVAMARVDGVKKGQVYSALMPHHGFEHWAKERCIVAAEAWPHYRQRARMAPWWRLSERLKRIPAGVLEAVKQQVLDEGPVSARELRDHGRVEPLDWSGWKGTGRMTTMALEVLWTRCEVAVHSREGKLKRYAAPERALPDHSQLPPARDTQAWELLERVEACGMLSERSGPWWSSLSAVRGTPLVEELVAQGRLERVGVAGTSGTWLCPAGLFERSFPEDDGRLRILAPLDPLLWDRRLVQHAFDFEYVWEVYKPAASRRWGYYVCPLLHRGELVGRFEGRMGEGGLEVLKLWTEGEGLDRVRWEEALHRHEQALSPG